jgi:oligopeptide/dipeptide ABC transporter ATP-binding protein
MPPSLNAVPENCPFAPRCGLRGEECGNTIPGLREIRPGHRVACFRIGGGSA